MTTWYWVSSFADLPLAVTAEVETAKTLTLLTGETVRKRSQWSAYYPTFEAAKAALVARLEKEVASARSDLSRRESALQTARALEPGAL